MIVASFWTGLDMDMWKVFHVIFIVTKYYSSFDFFSAILKNLNTVLSLQALQNKLQDGLSLKLLLWKDKSSYKNRIITMYALWKQSGFIFLGCLVTIYFSSFIWFVIVVKFTLCS